MSEVRLAELEKKAREIGRIIKGQMPEGVGFTLLVFTLGEGGWMTYMSSAERTTMIEAMKEFIEKAEPEQ